MGAAMVEVGGMEAGKVGGMAETFVSDSMFGGGASSVMVANPNQQQ